MPKRGQGRIDNDDNGLKEFVSPMNRRPLKGDVVPVDSPPKFTPRDPLGYIPKGQLGGKK